MENKIKIFENKQVRTAWNADDRNAQKTHWRMERAWSGLSVREYKELKGLKKENLRDNMTDIELVLNMLAEVTTTTLSKKEQPETFAENRSVAKRGDNSKDALEIKM